MSAIDLSHVLDCLAVADRLDGLLIYGASSTTLEILADGLTERVRASGVAAVDRVWLGSADTEDDLWGVPGLPFGWSRPGLLVPPEVTTRIVIVPDLSRLSLAAARAGVMLLGNRFVQIERRGISRVLHARHKWIAAVDEEHRDGVSRHLIDRFAIRTRLVPHSANDRQSWLTRQLGLASSRPGDLRPRATRSRVAGALRSVRMTPAALDAVMTTTADVDVIEGMRPAIALLRLAEATARLSLTPNVDRETVLGAAATLGLVTPEAERESMDDVEAPKGPQVEPATESASDDAVEEPRIVTPVLDVGPRAIVEARTPGPGDVVAASSSELDAMPAPLAAERTERDTKPGPYGALRLPWQQSRTAESGRGTIIGTRRAYTLGDLAIIDTLVAAAPFQSLRTTALGKRSRRSSDGMILRRSDLRSYRRAPAPGDLFVLVLDYTSVVGREWLRTLVPFLADAYALRAELCVVKVGAAGASNPLRADRIVARSVLVPSVAAALDEAAGRATPLADGLALAFQTIRQTIGHGRATAQRATLVVVTDGRGNLSLDASRAGRWTTRVGRQGIDDARRIARELRELPHVRRVLIDPRPTHLPDLPLALAAALGARVIPIEPRDA